MREYPSIGINIFMKRLLAGRTFIMVLQHGTKVCRKTQVDRRIDVDGTATGRRNDALDLFSEAARPTMGKIFMRTYIPDKRLL